MINLHNLNLQSDWPTIGFLAGDNLLSDSDFNQLSQFDFGRCTPKPHTYNRNSFDANIFDTSWIDDPAYDVLSNLYHYLNNYQTLKQLLDLSLQNHFPIDQIWYGGHNKLEHLYGGLYMSITDDNGEFHLEPHLDNRVVIANLQLYLEPEYHEDIGTKFHYLRNLQDFKQLPFRKNSGYFQINWDEAFHSVTNVPNVQRRTLLMGWFI